MFNIFVIGSLLTLALTVVFGFQFYRKMKAQRRAKDAEEWNKLEKSLRRLAIIAAVSGCVSAFLLDFGTNPTWGNFLSTLVSLALFGGFGFFLARQARN